MKIRLLSDWIVTENSRYSIASLSRYTLEEKQLRLWYKDWHVRQVIAFDSPEDAKEALRLLDKHFGLDEERERRVKLEETESQKKAFSELSSFIDETFRGLKDLDSRWVQIKDDPEFFVFYYHAKDECKKVSKSFCALNLIERLLALGRIEPTSVPTFYKAVNSADCVNRLKDLIRSDKLTAEDVKKWPR